MKCHSVEADGLIATLDSKKRVNKTLFAYKYKVGQTLYVWPVVLLKGISKKSNLHKVN